MKRPDEEQCREAFDTFVKRFMSCSRVTWEQVAQQNEPPDYYLLLDGMRYAVEVTTIMEMVSFLGGRRPLPLGVIADEFRQFVKDVESVARQKGSLRGHYLVIFNKPIDHFSSVSEQISQRLLDYIRRTSSLETAPEEIVFRKSVPEQMPQVCSIQKLGLLPDRVLCGGPVLWKWEGDAISDLCGLLNDSLDNKTQKLSKIANPKILLLLDDHGFADQEMYEQCVPRLRLLNRFYTVFVVQDGGTGFVLYSGCAEWAGASSRRPGV